MQKFAIKGHKKLNENGENAKKLPPGFQNCYKVNKSKFLVTLNNFGRLDVSKPTWMDAWSLAAMMRLLAELKINENT